MTRLLGTSLLILTQVAATSSLVTAQVTVVKDATILTVTNGTIEKGSILIRDGKISEIGASVEVPAGAEIIEATGKYVMPGIIDAHSHIATEAINEGTVSVSSMVSIQDVLDPYDVNIYRELAGGVTTSNILHGSANPIGGLNAVIKHRWGANAKDLLFEGALPGIKFALGENPKRSRSRPGVPPRYPVTRMGVMDVVRQTFLEARRYQQAWKDYEKQKASGPTGRSAKDTLVPPRRDLMLEPLVEILEGKRLVHAHCYRADEILQLLRLAEEFDFRIATLQHVLEGYKVADEIAAHGAGASTFSDWWGYKVEAYDAIPYNAALMMERGILVSINSDSAEEARHLNQEAAKSVKWGGVSEDQALSLITINPAKQLRIDDRVGSIEVGKDADLAIFNEHPLSVYAVAQTTIVDGKIYFDREEDKKRQAAVEEEKKTLLEKEKKSEENDTEPESGPRRRRRSRPSAKLEGVRR